MKGTADEGYVAFHGEESDRFESRDIECHSSDSRVTLYSVNRPPSNGVDVLFVVSEDDSWGRCVGVGEYVELGEESLISSHVVGGAIVWDSGAW